MGFPMMSSTSKVILSFLLVTFITRIEAVPKKFLIDTAEGNHQGHNEDYELTTTTASSTPALTSSKCVLEGIGCTTTTPTTTGGSVKPSADDYSSDDKAADDSPLGGLHGM